jgi:hypothetical protein
MPNPQTATSQDLFVGARVQLAETRGEIQSLSVDAQGSVRRLTTRDFRCRHVCPIHGQKPRNPCALQLEHSSQLVDGSVMHFYAFARPEQPKH